MVLAVPTVATALTHPPRLLISISLLSVGFFQLLYLHLNSTASGTASAIALTGMLIAALPRLATREKTLVSLAVAATILAFILSPTPLALIKQAYLQAAFLTAFMVLLSLLRDGAITSPSVLKLGRYLTSRPPGRRYVGIHIGGQLLGMVLNFGSLTLLGPLIQRGARSVEAGNEALVKWRERRQLSALIRGFSWTVAISPATVSLAITVSVVNGANILMVCFYGFSAVIGALTIGWLLDLNTGRQARRALSVSNHTTTATEPSDSFPYAAARRLALVCVTLFVISVLTIMLSHSRIVSALMLASPVVMVLWLLVQHKAEVFDTAGFYQQLKSIVIDSVPAGVPEAVTLASAGYIGVIVVALVSPQWFADATNITSLSAPWLYFLVMVMVPVLSNLAMPPILTVTVMGGLYSTLPFEGIDPNLLACALGWGWALNLTASPFGGVPLILGRITGIASTRLSWHWNGVFSAMMFAWCSLCLYLLTST